MIYTNTSNLYLDLLTDWLAFADRKGYSREAAFYHAARPVKFRGDSPSSRPVTWFWRVYRGGQSLSDVTSAAHTGTSKIAFGAIGEAVYLGYPDRFREININIVGGAGPNWSASMEYPAAVDSNGIPTRWALLGTLSDSTERFSQSGTIIFNPAPDWKPASVDGSDRLYYIRFLTTKDGRAPIAASIRGRDYVGAKGTTSGTIPVFDVVADTNKDGYLNDQEYQRRTPGKDARFLYESRIYTEGYGQMRPATNPSRPAFREWAANYHLRFLARYPLASGLFMDNSGGKAPVQADDAIESVDNYGTDAGLLLATVARAIAPRWIMANVGGAYSRADPVIQQNPAYFEEYGIRPMSHNWAFFEDLASLVAKRATLATPAPLAVLDSHPQRGSVTDPRTQIGALAYYYLLADPETTFLVFFGGYEPATSWTRHWIPAAAYDIGKPTGKWSQRATGPDPANSELSYRLYQRNYEKALVLYKPLSHVRGKTVTASLGDETATRHDLGGTYRPLKTDGTVGNPITSITLRNGEGAILIKVNP